MKSETYQHLKHLQSSWDSVGDQHRDYLRKIKDEFNFNPDVIYDIGACVLGWTNSAKLIWPNSKYFLFEAMEESEDLFIESGHGYHIAVLGNEDGRDITFYKNVNSPGGNSYYKENQKYSEVADRLFSNEENSFKRKMETLDSIVRKKNFPVPDLLKIDVQGCEVDILNGAKEIIKNTKHLIVELQHIEYNIGAKNVYESKPIIESMGFKLVKEKFSLSSHADADYHFINKSLL
jgi:FkbM family methyltransferase